MGSEMAPFIERIVMLLSKSHIVNITSRNITIWRQYYPDVIRGPIEVSSEEVIKAGSAKIKLYFKCDVCSREFERSSCKVINNQKRTELCSSCLKKAGMRKFYDTDAGKEFAKARGNLLKTNQNYISSRLTIGEKYRTWLTTDAGKEFMIGVKERALNLVKYGPENPSWNPRKAEYKDYAAMCRRYTYKNKNEYSKWNNYDKIGKSGISGAYQLDHIISIKRGFDNGYCPSTIGHISNLQIITWEENRSKWYQ